MEQESLAGPRMSGCPLAGLGALLRQLKCSPWFFCMGRCNPATQGLTARSNSTLLMQWAARNSKWHTWKLELNVLTYSRETGNKSAPVLGTEHFERRGNSSYPTVVSWLFGAAPWWRVYREPRLVLDHEAQRFTVLLHFSLFSMKM